MDARSKRPTAQDLMDVRHLEWLRTTRIEGGTTLVVIGHQSSLETKTALILSEREIEVLQLISFGYSTSQIATKMYLSAHTVTNHRKKMLTKTNCGNFAELVRLAISENLL